MGVMPAHDTYMLHVYRSRAVNGWQWSARVDDLRGRESARFADPEALLAYLGTVVRAGAPGAPPRDATPGAVDPATAAEDCATNDGGVAGRREIGGAR